MPLGLSCPLFGRSVAMWVGPSYFPRDRKLNSMLLSWHLFYFTSVVTLVSAVTLWLVLSHCGCHPSKLPFLVTVAC